MQIIAKVIPNFEYHICTSYSISLMFYGKQKNKLGWSGQENVFSMVFCLDVSYIIIKQSENKYLGVIIKRPITKQQLQQLITDFVDNTNFYTNRLQ